ncbi:tetratricopeptide (TPR) repeat protein [Mycoplasmoides fastidiosum]|uniref:Tetratricopeptide (TPR) repeat protein n=1 Tax=Mycoplasmoides fastidiosum TaxID=92758 RepID=A0ABU0LZ86_9BACT|nr:hypothetical protein [Mycoplasmoides fastidiosum]MDQ0513989.1 tetratricopeptide (TPR) repeat protein [Mycoplasmoides fastidiosum]UUD37597.1 hypothetical protein NPA10_03455 [Mycoplasmoides fastidiosum]
MKKFNLFKKNKLWLASLGIATTSSLILAACANHAQNGNNNAGNNNTNQTSNPGTETPKEPVVPPIPVVPKIAVATQTQKALATDILEHSGVKKVLENSINSYKDAVTHQIATITQLDELNQTKVTKSIAALGKTEDAMANAATSSVVALVKTLKDNVEKAEINSVPTAEKQTFKAALDRVIHDADELLKTLKALPEANAPKKLSGLENSFKTALDGFTTATVANAGVKLKELLDTKDKYQTELKVVTERLVNVEQKAFVLDSSTSILENYINTKVATFLTGTNGPGHKSTLEHLTTRVRTGVLGKLGADLWTVGNISEAIAAQNRPVNIKAADKSDQLYAIVVGLAEQQFAWTQLNNTLKELSYSQNLLLKSDAAVNLLALHVEQNTPVDVARLNAYLVTDSANIAKLLSAKKSGSSSILETFENIVNSINNYEKYLVVTGTDINAKTKLETDVEDVGSDTTKAAAVNKFKTAVKKLKNNFNAFKTEWDKSELRTLLVQKAANNKISYPLLTQAIELNQAIGVSKNYGDVLQVVGYVELLAKKISKITTAVENTNSMNKLFTTLQTIIADIDGITDGTFGYALTQFAGITSSTKQAKIKEIAEKTGDTKVGYVYTDLVDGKARNNQTPANLSFKQLKAELEKLQTGAGKLLTPITALLNSQLRPSETSQNAILTKHLTDLFNNGNVLPDTENH